jgi:histone-lysine N-methyltransferase SETMAR
MAVLIPNPAKCEVRSLICFLSAKGDTPAEIHRQLISVYGEDIMNRQNMAKWYHEFTAGRRDVHDDKRSGRPSVVTDCFIQKIEEKIHADRRITMDELHEQCSEVSRTVRYETVTERLGYRKLCARWVPRMLSAERKENQVAAAQSFLARYEEQGDDFLDCIVTGDETWLFHHTPETKHQLMQWHHTHFPSAKKFRTPTSTRKIMATVFWDRKGPLLVDFLPRRDTINAAAYCETLKRLHKQFKTNGTEC